MICKYCETENPENAIFCNHCGKRLDGKRACPSCKELCPEEALFCHMCGTRLREEERAAEAPSEHEAEKETTPKTKDKGAQAAKVKSALDLSGGICLMVGVLFAFVFILCMGLSATVDSEISSLTESSIIWDYFGPEYEEISDLFNTVTFSDFQEYTYLIPTILSTVVCAGSLVCVLVFTAIAATLYAKHFKNPETKYTKYAIAAILSFIIGASALLAVNYAMSGVSGVSVTFSDATLAGIILCSIFLGSYFVLKNASLGKQFIQKRTVIDFTLTTCAALFLILTAVFAVRPALKLNVKASSYYSIDAETNFMGFNSLICDLFDTTSKKAIPKNFSETYALSIVAQAIGIGLIVFTFATLIEKLSVYGKKSANLYFPIVLFTFSALYLVFTCLSLHFGGELMEGFGSYKLSIAAAPIVAVIMSAFTLATSITHTVLLKKTAEK